MQINQISKHVCFGVGILVSSMSVVILTANSLF